MPRFTELNGVIFTEDAMAIAVIGTITVNGAKQNSTLTEVKSEMARQAQMLGGNGVIRFNYTQRADTAMKNIFSLKWDTERLVLTGDVVRFDTDPRESNS